MGTQESTGKGISGTVGIDDLVIGELGHRKRLRVRVRGRQVALSGVRRGRGGSDEGRVGALGDDHESRSGRVVFRQVGNGAGDLADGRVLQKGE